MRIDQAIAHRSLVVEVDIACAGGFQFGVGAAQFFFLQYQFDLMHLQFMQQPSAGLGRYRAAGLRPPHGNLAHGGLGLQAQGGCVGRIHAPGLRRCIRV